MTTRARAAEETRQRVLDAAVALLHRRFRDDLKLDEVAGRAGVTVQTVLRLYGSRADLVDRALEQVLVEIKDQLDEAPPGDIAASVTAWFTHYEQYGDLVIRNLADEDDPKVGAVVRTGRAKHRRRVRRQFAPQLAAVPRAERPELLDALICACDVYAWKLLRRDLGRSRPRAEATMGRTVRALLEGS
jgi:AcrR family transcriptional regulator